MVKIYYNTISYLIKKFSFFGNEYDKNKKRRVRSGGGVVEEIGGGGSLVIWLMG